MPRAAWQAAAAPLIGIAGGARHPQQPVGAAGGAGDGPARRRSPATASPYSLRLAIFGLSVALALMVAQGFFLPVDDALPALLWGTVGGLTQVAWSLLVWVVAERRARGEPSGWDCARGRRGAALQPDARLATPPPRDPLRRRARRRRRRLPDLRHGRPRLLDPADDPLRDAPRPRRNVPAPGPAGGRHRARPGRSPPRSPETFGGSDARRRSSILIRRRRLLPSACSPSSTRCSRPRSRPTSSCSPTRSASTPGRPPTCARSAPRVGILIAFLAFVLWPNPEEGGTSIRGSEAASGPTGGRGALNSWLAQPNAAPGARRTRGADVEQPHVRDRGRDDQVREARHQGGRLPGLGQGGGGEGARRRRHSLRGRRAGLRRLLLRRLDLRPAGALPARPDRDPGRQRQQQLLDRLLGAVPRPPGGQGRPRRLRAGARLREDGAGQPRGQVHRPHQRARQARDADVRDPRPRAVAAGAADVRQRRPRPHGRSTAPTPTTTPGSGGRTTSTRSTTPTPSSRTSTRSRTSRRRR